MLLSAVSVLVVAQSSSEIQERPMNNPLCVCIYIYIYICTHTHTHTSEGAGVANVVYYVEYGLGYSGFVAQQREVFFPRILHFVDRASFYNLVNKANLVHSFS